MNRFKQYLTHQASRPLSYLLYDFVVIGMFLVCAYFGFITD